jgi:GDPmannose 4,6-dehydratase
MQWLMLQQEKPEDFVIATGVQHSVREFVDLAAKELGIRLEWRGSGIDEVGIVSEVSGDRNSVKVGSTIVKVDPRYFRPTEVETLLGDSRKAREKLGWVPKITFHELVSEMARSDSRLAQRDMHCQVAGFDVPRRS